MVHADLHRTLCRSCTNVVIGDPDDLLWCDSCREQESYARATVILEERILEDKMKRARRELAGWNDRLNGGLG